MAPLLEYREIKKSFSGVPVLRGISFALHEGRILGLVGENGAGKSTAMNILGGVMRPDSGTIRYLNEDYNATSPADATRQGIAFIHQELNLFTNLSIADNFFIARYPSGRLAGIPWINRKEMRRRSEGMLREVGLSVDPDLLVDELSQGERQLVEIARALGGSARLIILDEPTTSLAARDAERLFDSMVRLRAKGISMIYISHNLEDVLRMSDDIVVLRDGAVTASGCASDFSRGKLISCMVGRDIGQFYPQRPAQVDRGVVLEVRGISVPGIVENISFKLHRNEILGLAGLMGSGRTELARLLFGLDHFARGELTMNGIPLTDFGPRISIRIGIGLLTENRREEGLLMETDVAENVALVSLPMFARNWAALVDDESLNQNVGRHVELLQIKSYSWHKQKVKTLSGGNQQKVVFAKWLMARPSVLILDEPTRGIDVGAKQEVYRIICDLAGQGTAVLFISSELEELMGICDRILVMHRGEIAGSVERDEFDREAILRTAFGGGVDS